MANKLLKKKTSIQKVVKKQKTETVSGSSSKVATASKVLHNPGGEYVTAVGRRKTATARVRLYKAAGDFSVNDKLVSIYFQGILKAPAYYMKPFTVTGTQGKYAVTAKVSGSGIRAQIEAIMHATSRALLKITPEHRALLKPEGLLERDDRMKETRKIGRGGKARRTKQSPKR